MLHWYGGKLYRARWFVLVMAVLVTAAICMYSFSVFDALQSPGSGSNDPNSQSARAETLLDNTFKSHNANTIILLLSNANMVATDPSFQQAAGTIITNLKEQPDVLSIQSYYSTHSTDFLSRDQHQTFVVMHVSTKDGESTVYNRLLPFFTSSVLNVQVGGSVTGDVQLNNQLSHDLEFSESLTLPVVGLLLVVIFSGLTAAILPLIIGIFAVIGSFALLHVMTLFTGVSSFATNVVTIIGLGLSIDYALFIVTRFREEMAYDERNVYRALQRTMATAGRTVLFSGLTVCTSLLSLLAFPENVFRTVGMATIAAALVAMVGSLTLLPAILALLGRRVNSLSLQRLFRRKKSSSYNTGRGAWYRLSYFVMRWSIPITLATVTFLLLLGIPFLHAAFSTTDERALPVNASARQVVTQMQQNFPNQNDAQLDLAVRTQGDALSSTNLTQLDSYVNTLSNLPNVSQVQSVVSLSPGITLQQYQTIYAHPTVNPPLVAAAKQMAQGNVTEMLVTATVDPHSSAAHDLINTVRTTPAPSGLSVLVGGTSAMEMDQGASIVASLPYALGMLIGALFVLLFLMTGSLIMPLKAIILNVLSLTATFGAMVWVFQEGHLENLLRFQSYGSLDNTQPILIFAVAFGLSMDYEVFLLSRIKEQFDRHGDNREAVAQGLQRTGWLITSAALLLAIVVSAFITSRIIVVQEIGLGVSLAILMDATLVRALLVPAMMNLLGKLNWWAPRPLQRLWARVGLRETSPEPVQQQQQQVPPVNHFVMDRDDWMHPINR